MSARHSSCGCLACRAAAAPPLAVANRPGLSSIAYRSGTHGDFLSAMIAGLSRDASPRVEPVPPATDPPQPHQARPALRGLRTRDTDDVTIALLDAFAVTADILTFYSERLANEAYLGTATERASLQELGALVAYRLGRGAAAETMVAFSLEKPPAPLPETMRDPGIAPPVAPAALTLPIALRVQSVPGPDEQPQTFETVEQIEGRPEWNALPVARTAPFPQVAAPTEAWFLGTTLGLARGDTLLFTGPELGSQWDLRTLDSVDVDEAAGRTHVTWTGGVASTMPPSLPIADLRVYVFRRRFAVFAHNAPVWVLADPEADPPSYINPDGDPGFLACTASGDTTSTYLEGAHAEIPIGSWLVLDAATTNGRFRVAGVREASLAVWGVSGRTTALSLTGPALGGSLTPRDVTVLAVPERLTLAEVPDESTIVGKTLFVDGDATAMAKGRTILLAGTDASGLPVSEAVVVADVEAAGGVAPGRPAARTKITLATAPENVPTRASAIVFGNAAHATHGETVTQLLGSGDARVPFAAFRVQQAPLTFVRAETPRGTASTLEVRVDDVRWTEVSTTAAKRGSSTSRRSNSAR